MLCADVPAAWDHRPQKVVRGITAAAPTDASGCNWCLTHVINSIKLLHRPPSIHKPFACLVLGAPSFCFLFVVFSFGLSLSRGWSSLSSQTPAFTIWSSGFTLKPKVQPHCCQDKQVGLFYLCCLLKYYRRKPQNLILVFTSELWGRLSKL